MPKQLTRMHVGSARTPATQFAVCPWSRSAGVGETGTAISAPRGPYKVYLFIGASGTSTCVCGFWNIVSSRPVTYVEAGGKGASTKEAGVN
jgi:hypothetical protein